MKKNIPLIVGIALPLLMVILVAISIYVPTMFAKQTYSFVYSAQDTYDYTGTGDRYHVVNGKITKIERPRPTSPLPPEVSVVPDEKLPKQKSYLYMYDATSGTAKEISYEDAQKLTVIDQHTSPEGYKLEQGSYNRGVFEIFGGYNGSNPPDWYLRKGAVNKKVTLTFPSSTDRYYYYNNNFQFLGWIQK